MKHKTTIITAVSIIVLMIVVIVCIYLLDGHRYENQETEKHKVKAQGSLEETSNQNLKKKSSAPNKNSTSNNSVYKLRKIEDFNYHKIKLVQSYANEDKDTSNIWNKIPGRKDFSIWTNPRGDMVLVEPSDHYGWSVYDTKANRICGVPGGMKIGDTFYTLIYWLWRDSDSLLGVYSHDVFTPDIDNYYEIDEVKMFVFKINKKLHTGHLSEVKELPPLKHDRVICIEGITKEGFIVLSDAQSHSAYPSCNFNYEKMSHDPRKKFLGVYELKD